jgi:predicted metal-dependent phosphotriesterase family hydrolase
MAQIMTVLGAISPNDLGFTLPHEHIFIDLTAFPGGITTGGLDAIIDPVRHTEMMIEELNAFQAVGGKGLVEVTCRNMGGDIRAVKRAAEASGLNIIAGCGWYRESYMDHDIYYRATDELAEELVYEIEHGIDGTDIRPGIIGEIGVDYNHDHLSAKEERCLRAVAKAQRRTGLAVTTHLPKARIAFEVLDVLAEYDVPADRVILGHSDTYKDAAYHAALMNKGAYVQYDNIGSDYDMPRGEAELISLVADLVCQGFVDRILLSHDICCRSHLKWFGGRGFDYLATKFLPTLKQAGVSDEAIYTMTVENPKRVLTV